jgi:hypothetical protein
MEKRKILYQDKIKSIVNRKQNKYQETIKIDDKYQETINLEDISKELTNNIIEVNKDFLKIKIENNMFQIYGKTIITSTNPDLIQSLVINKYNYNINNNYFTGSVYGIWNSGNSSGIAEVKDSNSQLKITFLSSELLTINTSISFCIYGNFSSFSSTDIVVKSTKYFPPDPHIAVSDEKIIIVSNLKMNIYHKESLRLDSEFDIFKLFTSLNYNDNLNLSDPWIIFDIFLKRFIVILLDLGSGSILLSLSRRSNPISFTNVLSKDIIIESDWVSYIFNRSTVFPGFEVYPDYPKLGYCNFNSTSIYYITNNAYTIKDEEYKGVDIFGITFDPITYNYKYVYSKQINTTDSFCIFPLQIYDNNSQYMYFAESQLKKISNIIKIYKLENTLQEQIDFPLFNITFFNLQVNNYFTPYNVKQLNGIYLDSLGTRIFCGVVRNNMLYTAHTIRDSDTSYYNSVRWYKIFLATEPDLIMQDNIKYYYNRSNCHVWMPSINVDINNNVALCFSICSTQIKPSVGIITRIYNSNISSNIKIIYKSMYDYTNDLTNPSRWGDYVGLALDTDGLTFWNANEIVDEENSNLWNIYSSSFQVDLNGNNYLTMTEEINNYKENQTLSYNKNLLRIYNKKNH